MASKKFTILHSNDMHGDFLAELHEGRGAMIGGLALLSGYLKKVRAEEKNVIYVIAGDMVQGSLIDADYKGLSTMEIMNYLAPDVVALGNHEFDYGLPHLLFLEKVANFPIVNANLYIKNYQRRLMKSHHILQVDGFEILFTGIITEKILDALKMDPLIGSIVTLEEASHEVGKISDAYRHGDIDLTILLTHIGLESDIELAGLLKPEWGVDMIIGGHSHSFMERPLVKNGVLIAQAGNGTNQIGRFDITVDDETNRITDYTWKLIPITQDLVEPDVKLAEFIESFKTVIDVKYNTILTTFKNTLIHPAREVETPLGNVIADAVAESTRSDCVLVGSGSIRTPSLGPVVTLKDFLACFPYDDTLCRHQITGSMLTSIFNHIMRLSNRNGEGECYQINRGVSAVFDDATQQLMSLTVNGEAVTDESMYTICMQGYHFCNCEEYLGVTQQQFSMAGASKTVTTSVRELLEEFFREHQHLDSKVEQRLVYVNG